jgi:tRNA 2-thiouridine synthesizing protein B
MLHTVAKSPFERNALESCLRLALPGSSVLLLEDGVYGAVGSTAIADIVRQHSGELAFYVLEPDLKARGLADETLIDGMQTVGYEGFVDLVEQHDKVQPWL